MADKVDVNKILQHEIYLGRVNSGLINSAVTPGLEATYKAIRAILQDKGIPATQKQLAKLEADIAKAVRSNNAWSIYTDELNNVAIYEAGYTQEQVALIAASKAASDKFVIDYVNQQFISLESGSKVQTGLWPQFVQGNIDSQIKQINDIIRTGYAREQTLYQVGQNIRRSFEGVIKRDAETLARTGFAHYANEARAAWAESNTDLDLYSHLIFTFDNRISDTCRFISTGKTVFKLDDPKRRTPPFHFNAVAAGELVSTARGKVKIEDVAVGDMVVTHKGRYRSVLTVMKKPCDSNFVRSIKLNTDRVIRVTDEHPVLVDGAGWVRADEIKVGDKLFQHVSDKAEVSNWPSVVEGYPNDYPSIFDGDEVFFEVGLKPGVMASTIDFDKNPFAHHGKVPDCVTVDKLVHDIDPSLLSVAHKAKLTSDNVAPHSFSFRVEGFHPGVEIAHGVSSLHPFRVSEMDFTGLLGHAVAPVGLSNATAFSHSYGCSYLAGFGFCHGLDSVNPTPSAHSSIGKGELPLNGSKRLSEGEVMLTKECDKILSVDEVLSNHFISPVVTDISIVEYSGDVYNLEVERDNTFMVNDVAVHNCRTLEVFLPKGVELSGTRSSVGGQSGKEAAEAFDKRESRTDKKVKYRGKKDSNIFKPGQVRADTSYESWLRNQPAWFIDDVLGKAKGKAFRSGDKLSSFYDMTGRPLTLDELKLKG